MSAVRSQLISSCISALSSPGFYVYIKHKPACVKYGEDREGLLDADASLLKPDQKIALKGSAEEGTAQEQTNRRKEAFLMMSAKKETGLDLEIALVEIAKSFQFVC